MQVQEVFLSLQGEGLNQGLPTVFVRLAGCNLFPGRCCTYCDTAYAQSSKGEELTVDEIVTQVAKLSPYTQTRVCITGGEPLYQLDGLKDLVATLNKYSYYIEVFTNGTLPRPFWYTRVNSWVVDVKTPSSGVTLFIGDWMDSRGTDQIKLTVGTEEDLKFAEDIIARMVFNYPKVIVSPVIDNADFEGIRIVGKTCIKQEWLQRVAQFVTEHPQVRYSLQIQKVLWGNKRGV